MKKLIFEEDFARYTTNRINPEHWSYAIGGHGWGNKEWEYYTDRIDNSFVKDGCFTIVGKHEKYEDNNYTSARLSTAGKFAFQYGRIDILAQLPHLQGTWPAFWLLGDCIKKGIHWPRCGEIDIMEAVGSEPDVLHYSLHSEKYNFKAGNFLTARYQFPLLWEDFHLYSLDWQKEQMDFYFDDQLVASIKKQPGMDESSWPFDQPFFLLINMAVGGSWPGYPDDTFVQDELKIKYIRIWKEDKHEI